MAGKTLSPTETQAHVCLKGKDVFENEDTGTYS